MANNVDLSRIYGLQDCPPGGCGTTGIVNPNIPSLEQIASYNLATTTPNRPEIANYPNLFQSDSSMNTSSGQAQMLQPPANQTTQQAPTQLTNNQTSMGGSGQQLQNGTMQNMQSMPTQAQPTNGVSNALEVPMTQAQVNAENPQMLSPIMTYSQPFPVTADSIQYLNSFMRTQIGRRVTIEFLVGNDNMIEKRGILLAVGANFVLLNEEGTNDILSCDFYNIKFVTFHY